MSKDKVIWRKKGETRDGWSETRHFESGKTDYLYGNKGEDTHKHVVIGSEGEKLREDIRDNKRKK
jgi:hypothetical protein